MRCLFIAMLALGLLSGRAEAGVPDDRFAVAYSEDVIRSMRCPPPCARRPAKRKWKKRKPRPVIARPVIVYAPILIPLPRVRPTEAPEADEEEAATNAVWNRLAASLRPAATDVSAVARAQETEPPRLSLVGGFIREIGRAIHLAHPVLRGIVPPLANKVADLMVACPGTRPTSGVRRTYVRGTRKRSQHWTGNAVDIVGNPRCMYPLLAKWPGGYSTDYHRVRPNHLHLSWGGREHGKRFVHGGGKRKTRYARRHHRTG